MLNKLRIFALPAALALIFPLAFSGALSPQTQTNAPRRVMAVTIDDLPYVNPAQPPYLPNAQRATGDILRALKSHHAPAVGFVNEGKLQADGDDKVEAWTELLKQWIDAGMTLGNHTYSSDFRRSEVSIAQDASTAMTE